MEGIALIVLAIVCAIFLKAAYTSMKNAKEKKQELLMEALDKAAREILDDGASTDSKAADFIIKKDNKINKPMATPALNKGRVVRPAYIDNTDWSKFDRPAVFRKSEDEELNPESEAFAEDADQQPAKKYAQNKPRSTKKAGAKRSVSSFSELGALKGELANSEQPSSGRYEAI